MPFEQVHHSTMLHKVENVLDERLGLSDLSYRIPKHANSILYMLGGLTLFCFIVLIATGIYLAQFYNPDPAQAHNSILYIMTTVPFGAFIRSVHHWSAQLVIILLILHFLRVFILGSYKRPREAIWLTGVALFAVTMAFIFTGTVLKWDQEAVEALAHNEAVGEMIGAAGSILTSGFSQSTSLLTRLYNAHVSVLLMAFGAFIFLHFYLIKRHGISPKATYNAISQATKGIGSATFLTHIKKLTGYGFITLALLSLLAFLFPAEIGYPGVSGAEVTKPPWFFLPLYALENFLGLEALLYVPIILFFLLLAVPFIDRSQWLSPRRRKLVVGTGLLLWLIIIALGIYAWLAPPVQHIMGATPKTNIQISLVPKAFAHGGQKDEHSEETTNHMDAMAGSMTVETDSSVATQAIILFAILLSLQIGLILIREGVIHK